jgi:hypothetical protein
MHLSCYRGASTRASGGMADALASGASEGNLVGVQVPPRPPVRSRIGDEVLLVVDVDRNRLLLADANSSIPRTRHPT